MTKIAVIGNAPVDSLASVDDVLLEEFDLKKGDFQSVDPEVFHSLLECVQIEELQSGGSCANSAWLMGMIGSDVGFLGRVGSDLAGEKFYKDLQLAKVDMPQPDPQATTMQILVLITPDGQRTFVTQGVTAPLEPHMVDASLIEASEWLLIEGYLFLGQQDVVKDAISIARASGTRVALTLSSMFAVEKAYDELAVEIMKGVDLIIANDDEMNTLAAHAEDKEKHSVEVADLVRKISETSRLITHGAAGAEFHVNGERVFEPSLSVSHPVDTTGAGDAFVAGFMSRYIQGDEFVISGLKLGHLLASRVIMQVGGRLKDVNPDMLKGVA